MQRFGSFLRKRGVASARTALRRVLSGAVLASVFFGGMVHSREPPRRVVSLSLCVDELVLTLAEPTQVRAVSRLAADPRYSRVWQLAQVLPRHDGLAEQVVALEPDLVIAASFEQGRTTELLRQLGIEVRTLPSPSTLADVPASLRLLAGWLGTEARTERLLAQWQHTLDAAKRNAITTSTDVSSLSHTRPMPLALSLAPNAYSPGQLSLKNELLRWTGYRTAADELGLRYDSELTLEQIVLLQPDVLFLEEQQGNRDALAYRVLEHPALRHSKMQRVAVTSADWLCPGLGVAAMAAELAHARDTLFAAKMEPSQ